GGDGRLVPVSFGRPGGESRDPGAAARHCGQLAGKTVAAARKAIVELLRAPAGGEPALRGEPVPVTHAVKFYEKGDRPLEFISTRQWFVRLLDKKEALLAKGDQIEWHPDFMRLRYRNWTENLQMDWCISRQRFFGPAIPVWYPLGGDGRPDHARPIVAEASVLPVDPMTAAPPGYEPGQRDRPDGFTGEPDVFDTWFTSSLTPQISSGWLLDPARHRRLFPADIRPQSHEIIRTWAFYTIAKALLHEDTIPWRHAVISGWILDPERKKMSKSRGNVVTPMHLLDEYTADVAHGRRDTGACFWSDCTHTFLELAKGRAREGDPSAVAALRLGLGVLLRLFAPVLPYITEEIWSWAFAEETGSRSIHAAPWPC